MKLEYRIVIKPIVLLLVGLLISSCVPRERIAYFQGDLNSYENSIAKDNLIKIEPDDLLVINVFGRDRSATKIFNQESNLMTTLSASGSIGTQSLGRTYLVDKEGNIEFPVLGKVNLGGKSRIEAIEYMKGLLKSEIVDPGVDITISNYRITILGEVSRPGTYKIENEKITILEALGMAGDLTINGQREDVLIVREEGGDRTFYRLDLTSDNVFSSPVFYLKQNDMVYVEPNQNARNRSSTIFQDVGFLLSIGSFLTTLILLFTRL